MLRHSIIRAHRDQWLMHMKLLWISWSVIITFAHRCEYQASWCCSSECKYWHTLLKYNHRKKTQKKEKNPQVQMPYPLLKYLQLICSHPAWPQLKHTRIPCLLCSNTFMHMTINKKTPVFYPLLHWLYCPLPWLSHFPCLQDLFGILEQWLNMLGNIG